MKYVKQGRVRRSPRQGKGRAGSSRHGRGPAGREYPLDMDQIERIEFIPGPGRAVHGQNAMFGMVNVITRTGADGDRAEDLSFGVSVSGISGCTRHLRAGAART